MDENVEKFRSDRLAYAERSCGVADWALIQVCEEENGDLKTQGKEEDGKGDSEETDVEF